ncbi:hypothetical protein PPL_00699 [Heterostelium album PN500]|uniref:Uncharacterized protein n=1 Tax=Heterostelium pallidum (strain ATCC 26659 / Pp 5 / PN500) TaxID=670386 RepID=D3AX69_HETP5|nr:hypothetical protein PPL_00699 [Heterostelium album PN500]EFA86138.1 hypothetical protein PPL_00699 [Heterostelium album PN500]|eukprot:XP_020438243.1 hypothetical protein PPL_00699 [Heterostelium album PN500]
MRGYLQSFFKGNQTLNGGVGGPVFVAGENPGQIAISNTTFNQNNADGSGGVTLLDKLFSKTTMPVMVVSILTDNTAVSNGGAIYMFESSYGPLLWHITILSLVEIGN